MNISCEIVKDLLPLYIDGVCSNESKALVEEHLAQCPNCQGERNSMTSALPVANTEQNKKEAEAMQLTVFIPNKNPCLFGLGKV
jgi:predicted anti-sigma-YlaC factor YlaD